ncbi:transglutaminase-like domain-containing protein, partial [Francisella tularensis subsp. holarctica]|uniref:transglutaminase-like domain-containing protein n=1 Tax=Francisella tularensis TaxID=263 RepID=UPI002381A2EC
NRYDSNVLAILDDIHKTIFYEYNYVSGSTNLTTTAYDLYVTRQGVCQDFSILFICLARLLGIPARYRSGYRFNGGTY